MIKVADKDRTKKQNYIPLASNNPPARFEVIILCIFIQIVTYFRVCVYNAKMRKQKLVEIQICHY